MESTLTYYTDLSEKESKLVKLMNNFDPVMNSLNTQFSQFDPSDKDDEKPNLSLSTVHAGYIFKRMIKEGVGCSTCHEKIICITH